MAETWIIKDRTWGYQSASFDVSFTSNGETFTSFWPNQPAAHNLLYGDKFVVTATGKDTSTWIDGNGNHTTYELTPYKIVTFDTPPTGALRTWLDSNAEKQQPTSITLDLSTIGLSEGTHSIQMKLSDDEVTKIDSELSNAVTYIVDTWEYPEEDGDDLIIRQAYDVTADGDDLIIE